jgi:hypothetical protein
MARTSTGTLKVRHDSEVTGNAEALRRRVEVHTEKVKLEDWKISHPNT